MRWIGGCSNHVLGDCSASRTLAPCSSRTSYIITSTKRGQQTLCSRHRVPVLRLGRLRVTAAVAGMREIAAGAFAQRLLGLRFHPRLLDVAAVLFQGSSGYNVGRTTR